MPGGSPPLHPLWRLQPLASNPQPPTAARPPTPLILATPLQVCNSPEPEGTVICDSCDGVWHIHCLDPPLADVPEGDWHCTECRDKIITGRSPPAKRPRKQHPAKGGLDGLGNRTVVDYMLPPEGMSLCFHGGREHLPLVDL